ncbi:MAG: CinA family nicotinamide mononucleotide deamidase-related protein [Endomicrobia bacterium]|nr:CinA family nicotinamide mononucleotide deamidase-related protein [Endomicrobiia bacterium]
MVKVSVITTGTELLKEKPNTNLFYITKKISTLGLKVDFCSITVDDPTVLKTVFNFHFETSDIVLLTGGIGPTLDDVTVETIAKILNKKQVFVREVYENIVRYFINKNQEMPPFAERQAYVIEGAEVLPNKIGHAPGQKIVVKKDKSQKIIFILPGPPRELQPMFDEYVFPQLQRFQIKVTKEAVLHICNVPESKVQEIIKPVVDIESKYTSDVEFSILSHLNIVDIHITVSGDDELKVDEELTLIKKEIYDCFKNSGYENTIFAEGRQVIEYVVGMMLGKQRKTLAVAESCTGGLLANRITNIPGSSFYFLGGVVAYSNTLKAKLLGVKKETLDTYGAVSEQTVKEMCLGVKNLTGADYCISISGIAGPAGGSKEKPVGTVWICIFDGKEFETKCFRFLGTRLEVKEQAVNAALDMLRLRLGGRK